MSKRSHSEFALEEGGDGSKSLPKLASVDTEQLLSDLIEALPHVNNFQISLKKLKKQRLMDEASGDSSGIQGMEARLAEHCKMLVPLLPTINALAQRHTSLEKPNEKRRPGKQQEDAPVEETAKLPEPLEDSRFSKKFASSKLGESDSVPSLITSFSSSLAVPSSFTVSPFTLADIPSELPPLPKILVPSLEETAFTHKGLASAKMVDYERLEWLGDAYLDIMATLMIFQTFGASKEGDLSFIREILNRNSTFAGYAQSYHFDKRLKVAAPLQANDKHKIWGDVFESYVGALILSDPAEGLSRAMTWLKALWAKSLERHLKDLARSNQRPPQIGQAVGPKDRLSAALVVKGISLSYEPRPQMRPDRDNPKIQLFEVDVFLVGWGKRTYLGSGTARSKTEAGEKAALAALANTKLLKQFSDKKAAYMAALEK